MRNKGRLGTGVGGYVAGVGGYAAGVGGYAAGVGGYVAGVGFPTNISDPSKYHAAVCRMIRSNFSRIALTQVSPSIWRRPTDTRVSHQVVHLQMSQTCTKYSKSLVYPCLCSFATRIFQQNLPYL